MSTIEAGPRAARAGLVVTATLKSGLTISGEVESNNSFAEVLEFVDEIKVRYESIKTVTMEGDPRWEKPGVYIYYSLGLEDDGHMVNFPNLILKTRDHGWYRIGNAGGLMNKITEEEVPFASMLPLTIHPDYVKDAK